MIFYAFIPFFCSPYVKFSVLYNSYVLLLVLYRFTQQISSHTVRMQVILTRTLNMASSRAMEM